MLTDFTVVRQSVTWKGEETKVCREESRTEPLGAALGHSSVPRQPCMQEVLSKCLFRLIKRPSHSDPQVAERVLVTW